MPDYDDVVRRVVLKIIVDANNLASDVAAARAKLKALDDATDKSAASQGKSHDKVTDAIKRQKAALAEAETISKGLGSRQVNDAKSTADSVEKTTKSIKEQSAAQVKAAKDLEALTHKQEKNQQEILKLEEQRRTLREHNDADSLIALAKVEKALAHNGEIARQDAIETARLRKKADDESAERAKRAEEADINRSIARGDRRTREAGAEKRKDDDALARRNRLGNESAARVARSDTASNATTAARLSRDDAKALEARIATAAKEAQKLHALRVKDSEQERALGQKNADAETARNATLTERVRTQISTMTSQRLLGVQRVVSAEASAERAQASARDAADRADSNINLRRVKTTQLEVKGATEQLLRETRLGAVQQQNARNEEIYQERLKRVRERPTSARSAIGSFVGVFQGVAREFVDNFKPADEATVRVGRLRNAVRETRAEVSRLREGGSGGFAGLLGGVTAVGRAFATHLRPIEDSVERVGRFRNALGAVRREVSTLSGSGGGGGIINFFGAVGGAAGNMADAVVGAASKFSTHMLSMRGLILLVVAALGPLTAMLGSLGAGALVAGDSIISLASSLAALPGILGAAAVGIAAVMVAIKPLNAVFDAYTKQQKTAATATVEGSKAQRDAARKLIDARRELQDANRGIDRATENERRATEGLSDARRDAARSIQDYRMALQKLKYDQEGAELGIESAEQAYRRALADPTANNLARKQARHEVQGALFDQRDQKVAGGRLVEDAAQAERRGVENTPAVVSARNAIKDAEFALETARIRLRRATEDLTVAESEEAAGGPAALKAKLEYQAALAKLSPSARAFTTGLIGMNGAWKDLQKNVSEKLFAPLVSQLPAIKDLMGPLGDTLGKAADAMGRLGAQAIELLSSPEWTSFFGEQAKESVKIIDGLGNALLSVADGVKGFIEAARPFTTSIVDRIEAFAARFDEFTNSSEGQSRIKDFLAAVDKQLDHLLPIIGNLVSFFGHLFMASGDFSTDILGSLEKVTGKWADWAKDMENPNSGLRKFLRDTTPLLKDIGGLIGDVVSTFAKMASDPKNIKEAQRIIEGISGALPKIASIFTELSESGGFSKLIDAVSSILGAIDAFLKNGGSEALGTFADALKLTADVIKGFVTDVPGAASGLGILAGALAILAGASIFSKFTGLLSLLGLFGSIRRAARDAGGGISGLVGVWDLAKDKLLGRERGDSNIARDTRRTGTPGGSTPGRGGVVPHLSRMETQLDTIIRLLGGRGSGPGGGGVDVDPDGPNGPRRRPGRHRAGEVVEDVAEDTTVLNRSGAPGSRRAGRSRLGRGGRATGKAAVVAALVAAGFTAFDFFGSGAMASDGTAGADPVGSAVDMFGGPTGLALTAGAIGIPAAGRALARRGTQTAAEAGAHRVAGRAAGGIASRLGGRVAAGLGGRAALGIGGRLAGAAAGLANPLTTAGTIVGLVGDLAFEDRKSTAAQATRASGAILTGAGIGAGIGSVIPGVGTAIGAGVGALGGAAYSLAKDKGLRDKVGGAWDGAYEGFMNTVGSPLAKWFTVTVPKFFSGIGKWFTVTLPKWFREHLLEPIENFFTKTLPDLPGKVFDAFFQAIGRMEVFFTEQLPEILNTFFTETLPDAATTAWGFVQSNLLDPIGTFITETIPNFFTETIPTWFSSVGTWLDTHVVQPVTTFITETIPNFFTDTIPRWFEQAPQFFMNNVITPLTNFFTVTLPNFFTVDLPNAISKIPGFLYSNIVEPVLNFFTGLPGKVKDVLTGSLATVKDWATNLFDRADKNIEKGKGEQRANHMSGGLVAGIYSGIEDAATINVTPGEHVMRRRVVEKPYAKMLLSDLNEERVDPSYFYKGLSRSAAPNVMTMRAPTSGALSTAGTGQHLVTNNNQGGLHTGDIIINNPVREKAEHSMRRTLHTVAFRLNR